jgi:hypothetical protein
MIRLSMIVTKCDTVNCEPALAKFRIAIRFAQRKVERSQLRKRTSAIQSPFSKRDHDVAVEGDEESFAARQTRLVDSLPPELQSQLPSIEELEKELQS